MLRGSVPSTFSTPSIEYSNHVSESTPSSTTVLLDRPINRGLVTDTSQQSRTNASIDIPANTLLQQVRRLHVDTPATANTPVVTKAANSPNMAIPYQYGGGNHAMLTPPSTPKSAMYRALPIGTSRRRSSTASSTSSTSSIDITAMDLDTTHAQLLGTGLWSKVYRLASFLPSTALDSPASSPPSIAPSAFYTPPSTPQSRKPFELPQAFAVKVATRKDALPVFEAEAKILQHLQSSSSLSSSASNSETHIVPFYGFSPLNSALIFECCDAGTLESLISVRRTPSESLHLFRQLAPQLVSALAFIHAQGVVHADIKPANILLSTSPTGALNARFADFSASFLADGSEPPKGQFGGTWAYMAPELLSRDIRDSTPTFKSDVYALGVALLGILISGDPFVEVADALFMLREAVKMGDVLAFARRQPGYVRRIEGAEKVWKEEEGGDLRLDEMLKVVLRKKREERVEAREWVEIIRRAGL